jgi:hypothetical protein
MRLGLQGRRRHWRPPHPDLAHAVLLRDVHDTPQSLPKLLLHGPALRHLHPLLSSETLLELASWGGPQMIGGKVIEQSEDYLLMEEVYPPGAKSGWRSRGRGRRRGGADMAASHAECRLVRLNRRVYLVDNAILHCLPRRSHLSLQPGSGRTVSVSFK